MRTKRFKFSIVLFSFSILSTCGAFFGRKEATCSYAAGDGISDDEAAWHIEATTSWVGSTPGNSIKGESYFRFLNDSGETLSESYLDGKVLKMESFNCLKCPTSYEISFLNNGYVNKTLHYEYTIKYRGQEVDSISKSYKYTSGLTGKLTEKINLSEKIAVYNLSIQNSGVSNFSNICTSFNIPQKNPKLPYINNHNFKDCGTYNDLPKSNDSSKIFLGYKGSTTENEYYSEELIPINTYDNADNGVLVPVFGEPIISNYPLNLFYDASCNTPYENDDFSSYDVSQDTILPVLENTNFVTYDGWLEVVNGKISTTPVYSIAKGSVGEKTFVANSTRVHYKVSLNLNGATECDALTEYVSGTNTTLPTPKKNGFTFGGWYDNNAFEGNPITSISNSEYGDKTFYAKWNGIKYNVSLVLYNATSCDNLNSYLSGVGAVLPIPVRTGYSFGGWYSNSNYTGNPITSISDSEYGDKTFHAKWNLDNSNEGAYRIVCHGYLGSTEAPFNVKVKLFNDSNVCFYTSPTVSIEATSLNDPNSFICDVSLSFLPYRICFEWQRDYEFLYVVRTSHSCCDVYYKNEKITGASFNQNLGAGAGSGVVKSPEGCSFEDERNHQYLKSNASAMNFSFNNNVVEGTFSAIPGKSGPTILGKNYFLDSGSVGQYSYEKPVLIDDFGNNLSLKGFFDVDGNSRYYDENLNPTDATYSTNGLVLYPGFEQSLELETNGGSLSYSKTSYLAGLNNNLPACNKTGYEFVGWCTDSNLTSKEILSISQSEKNPLKLYAKYKPISYKINLINSVTNEDIGAGITGFYDSYIDKEAIAQYVVNEWEDSVYHYSLSNYFTSADCNEEFNFEDKISGETNIYIGYSKIELKYHHVNIFIEQYMHPEISFDNNANTGLCRGDSGYYNKAKEGFNALSEEERRIFLSEDQYFEYTLRLEQWAIANGDYIDYQSTMLIKRNTYYSFILSENDSDFSNLCLISCLLIASALLITIYIKYRKNRYF